MGLFPLEPISTYTTHKYSFSLNLILIEIFEAFKLKFTMLARVSAANGRNATSSSDEKLVAAAQTVVGFRLREDQSVEIQSVDTG